MNERGLQEWDISLSLSLSGGSVSETRRGSSVTGDPEKMQSKAL